jgi:hypothetical protein
VVLGVLAHAGQVVRHGDAERPEEHRRAYPRELQQVRGADGAGRQQHLPHGAHPALAPALAEDDARYAAAFHLQPQGERARLDAEVGAAQGGAQEAGGCAEAAPASDAALVVEGAFLAGAVVVRVPRQAALLHGAGDEGLADRVPLGDGAHVLRTAGAAPFVGAASVVLDAVEGGQHVGPGPAGVAALRPGVEVARLAAHPERAVDGGRTAERLAARKEDGAPVHARPRLGLEAPSEARVPEGLQEAGGGEDVRVAVGPARFQQQHARGGVGGQAVRQHAAGRAGADDDVVVSARQGFGGHATRVGPSPATVVRTMWRRSVALAKGVARCSTARLSHSTRSRGRQRWA